MAYACRVERDSVSPEGTRLTSFVVTYPRVAIAEFCTHRLNSDSWNDAAMCERSTTRSESKNSASSRAIPFARMVRSVVDDPYVPERFGRSGPGMSEDGYLEGADAENARNNWLAARDSAIASAASLLSRADRESLLEKVPSLSPLLSPSGGGLASSVCKGDINRLLEPFCWVTQLITSSAWDNFFALRCHATAFYPFRKIARAMFAARRESTPTPLRYGQWHLPFVSAEESSSLSWMPLNCGSVPDAVKFSVARCAWVSYDAHDGEVSPERMLATYRKLLESKPAHASPAEAQATPMPSWCSRRWESNLSGWLQFRKLLPGEVTTRFDPSEEEVASWGL